MNKSLVIILVSVLLLSSCIESQEQDTIITPIPSQGTAEYQELLNPSGSMGENITKVNTIYQIASSLIRESDLEEAKRLADSQLEISLLIEYQKGEALAYNILAIVDRRNGDIKGSLDHQLKAYSIWDMTNDYVGKAKSSINIGHLYRDKGLYDEAISYYNTAIELISKEEQYRNLTRVAVRNLGRCHEEKGNLVLAEDYYRSALDMAIDESNQGAINSLYNDLGIIYELQEDYATALSYFQRYLELSQSISSSYDIALAHNNVGYMQLKQGNINSSVDHLQSSLNENNAPDIQIRALQNLGILHRERGKFQTAISYLHQAEEVALGIDQNLLTVSTTKELAITYEKIGNTEKALEYTKKLDIQQRELKDAEYKLVLQGAKDFKEVEVRYASFNNSLLIEAIESKYSGYFFAALFVGMAIFVASFYSSVYKMWRA